MLRSNARRGALSAAAAAIALGFGAAPASAVVNGDGSVTVDLLNITDFHGALLTAPNIAQQVAAARAANPDTIFSAVGDSIGGTTFESAVAQDVPTIQVLNDAGLQVSTVGNHEFDQGFADLRDRVLPLANFSYLAANVTGQSDLPPYEIITTASGVDVAYIGTVTQTTPTVVSPGGIAGLGFEDPVATTNAIAAQLTASGEADVIVALTHEGTNVVAPNLSPDIDVVFAGHSHEALVAATPSGAPVVQAGASGTLLGRVSVTVATNGAVTTDGAANTPVTSLTAEQADGTGALDETVFDASSTALVRTAYADARERGNQVVGTIAAPFNAASNTGTANVGTPQHRGAESPLGNLIAEIALETVNDFGLDADFGIMNPGGLRADLDPDGNGQVTFREAFNVTSFSNTIGTVDLTGSQVDTLLEQQFEARPPRPMLALGLSPQLTYLYDPSAPIGDRVDSVTLNGSPIDPAATYRVASNTFLLEGADGFTVLGEGTNLQESGVIDWQATVNYLAARPNLAPSYSQQSIGVTYGTDLSRPIAPGEQVTIELSSLSFTSTEPKAEVVTASVLGSNLPRPATTNGLGAASANAFAEAVDQPAADPGTVLAAVPVDNANVVDSNETGRASVTITVPADTVDGQLFVAYAITGAGVPTDGVVLEFTVAADATPPVPTAPTPTTPAPATTNPPVAGRDQGSLPQTGVELAGPALAIATLLVLAGLSLVLRRRATA